MITAKRVISIISLILILFVSACASETRQNDPPELLFPVSNRVNTAIVTRGTIEQVTGYPGIIRIDSDRLTFGNTTLRFSEFFVMTGDRVTKGELLARLDTRDLDKNTLINNIQNYVIQKNEWQPHNENSFSPALCNRIDSNTSGIVLAAKNAETLRIINGKIKNGIESTAFTETL